LCQCFCGIRSRRQTIREIEVNVAYRWFLGYGLYEPIPHFTTFGKNYVRRFKDTDIFEQIFGHILAQAIKKGFVDCIVPRIEQKHFFAVMIDAHMNPPFGKASYGKGIEQRNNV